MTKPLWSGLEYVDHQDEGVFVGAVSVPALPVYHSHRGKERGRARRPAPTNWYPIDSRRTLRFVEVVVGKVLGVI